MLTLSNRYIKLINNGRGGADTGHWLYDYKIDGWHRIQIEPESCVINAVCQVGAFPLPQHYMSEDGLKRRRQGLEHHEMIYFGGISDSRAYKVTLFQLQKDDPWRMTVKGIDEEINVHALQEDDRFFYNFPFYLRWPTRQMVELNIDGANDRKFDRTRFVGVAGREAFHVFDLKIEMFVAADPE